MSKRAIVVAPSVGRVLGMYGDPTVLRMWIGDRKENREAFDGEYVVRLPRRFWVNGGRLELRPEVAS